MGTTDRSRKNTSTTDSTEIIQEAKFLCGEQTSSDRLKQSIIRLALADLGSTKKKLRNDAMRYILSLEFLNDCRAIGLDHKEILKTVNDTVSLKQIQKRAIIKKLIQKLRV